MHTVAILEKLSSSYHKEVQRIAYRQRKGKCLLPNAKSSNYELVVFLGNSFCQFPYLTFVTKFEPVCGLKRLFSSAVSVCDPLHLCTFLWWEENGFAVRYQWAIISQG